MSEPALPERGLSFPAEHVLIAFGPPGAEFCATIEAHLVAAGGVRTASPVTQRSSRGGRYQSVSVPLWVSTRAELQHLYAALRAHPEVIFRL